MMFSAFCPTHDATVLMTRRNMVGLVNGNDGPIIHWRCTCGHEGLLDRHGSVADPPAAEQPEPTAVHLGG
jgi:hypothetical protein